MDPNLKVLVVDDFATMRRIVKNILKDIGFTNISEAEDGAVALKQLQAAPVDLIICDWNMPNMSGLDLLKAVRADEKLKATPFVMVTAEAQKTRVVEAVQAGVSNYIVKPFTADAVKEKLKKVLG
ncbi:MULTISPECIES: chemotaxis response regulator CheY [Desulfatibacillum]|jgi:two-component system chemotaxis response regulator CheY|uniref:Response regulator receiver domain protein (CheY-like) n=2 Tax=Desulfatibacillum TaxID=218207 RepID=B8FJT6_DESAL|nr:MULTISPECIES: chemotaxis response regulator CheY [Desulfatibacillum]ACL02364.1 Response regulator receiver domain protein (CheY-like) [Desulfatibacillum aliphaticivorans]SHL13303.1 two-component system, chemotaxis family, response regulator CheY [Desulfatibacillum alkenivorans DSM 16219]